MLNELARYDWPGNIRELESTIQRALISSGGDDVLRLRAPLGRSRRMNSDAEDSPYVVKADLASVERSHIIEVLNQAEWKIAGPDGAAERLGLPPSTLRSKMNKLGISR